ncbi:hypothetical protein D9M72_284370 [compost metagenome]
MAGRRHDGLPVASSPRPRPMMKAMKVSVCAADCSALRACASHIAWALSTSTTPCAATATSSTCVATMAITSSERRSRPAGSTRVARRASPRSAAQTPSQASSSAPMNEAITGVRLSGCSAWSKPSPSAAPIACSRSKSSGQASRRSSQNSPLSGEAARLVSSASNCWRRCDTTSVPRWRTSIASSLARRMSASSALRSLVSCARWRVMLGSSVAPAAGGLPSSPRRALRSASSLVRAATNLSACTPISLICASCLRASSSAPGTTLALPLPEGAMRANCARSSAMVGGGAAAATVLALLLGLPLPAFMLASGCAKAPPHVSRAHRARRAGRHRPARREVRFMAAS